MALTVTVKPGATVIDGVTPLNAATLNALAVPTVSVSGTIGGDTSVAVDGTTIDQGGAGSSLQVVDGGISNAKLADGSVNAGKLASNAVEAAKIKDGNVTAAKLDDATRLGAAQYAAGTWDDLDTYDVTLIPAPAALSAGMVVRFRASAANSTGACKLDVNSLGAKDLTLSDGSDPVANSIGAGMMVEAAYDSTADAWIITSPIGSGRYQSSELTLTAGVALGVAHGLGTAPGRVWAMLKCTDAGGDAGYAQNDLVPAHYLLYGSTASAAAPAIVPFANATQIKVAIAPMTTTSYLHILSGTSPGTSLYVNLTASKWKLIVYAER
ncbi:MAG TPA: hypothetical protein P5255_14695 [Phycisphaerae bacterium]|nr:hypothetical protein [Phycisphaerae bacterium]